MFHHKNQIHHDQTCNRSKNFCKSIFFFCAAVYNECCTCCPERAITGVLVACSIDVRTWVVYAPGNNCHIYIKNCPNVGWLLAQRLRRCANNHPTLGQISSFVRLTPSFSFWHRLMVLGLDTRWGFGSGLEMPGSQNRQNLLWEGSFLQV